MKKTILKKLSLVLPIFLSITMMAFAQRTIKGTVTDDSGAALIGVNIIIRGTNTGTITDIDGRYSIAVPEGEVTLEFSYTGYGTKEIEVAQSKVVDVILEESELLGCVIICCYSYITDEEYWFQETQKLLAEKAALKAANIEKRSGKRFKKGLREPLRRNKKQQKILRIIIILLIYNLQMYPI